MTVATMPESRSSASPQLTVSGLVERHRRTWLADAVAYLRVLDWHGLAGRQLAIIDFEDVPNLPQRAIAFTSPGGLFELVQPFIPRSNLRPGPAMFIDTAAVADHAVGTALDRLTEADAVWIVRVIVNAVGIHEYAHAAASRPLPRQLPVGGRGPGPRACRRLPRSTRCGRRSPRHRPAARRDPPLSGSCRVC